MYVILTYDVDESRCSKVCNYLRTYLHRVQNSVFEGELTEAKMARMKAGLREKIDCDVDSVLLWVLRDVKWAERETMGLERHPISNIL